MSNSLWDLAGVDGLLVAQQLFGEEVGYLGPFQSLETVLEGKACSVLRLCDRNFRIAYPGPLHQFIAPLQPHTWLKQFDWLSRLALPISQRAQIISHVTVRPPHRLENFPNHQAIPGQLQGIPLLIWQHPYQDQTILELHAARNDLGPLTTKLEQLYP